MPWWLASFPWLVYLVAAWLGTGLFVARALLRLRNGLEVACLALPLGLVSQLLVANALGHVLFLPFALWWAALGGLAAGAWWLVGRARWQPLAWDLDPGRRWTLFGTAAALAVGLLAFNLTEVFSDDGGHASVAHLLASGQFPLRLPCDPSQSGSYHYGGDLLAAQIMVVAGLRPFEAVDLLKSLVASCVIVLAFVTGWRPERRVGAGLLGAFLLVTAGPMLWVFLPLSSGGLAQWALSHPALGRLPGDMARLVSDPWHYSVVTPGFITPTFAHAQRTAAWAFAPFQCLLVLALLEAPVEPRRRGLALVLVLGATALLQLGALPILLTCLGAWALWRAWRGAAGGWREALSPAVGLFVAGLLLVLQGGALTDSLSDRLAGRANPSLGLRFAAPLLPSCREGGLDLHCALVSVANLGIFPLLAPWLALSLWRRGPRLRLGLVAGALASQALASCFRYAYFDWNIQRLITFATWILAVLAAGPLFHLLSQGRGRRALALALLLVGSWGGLVTLGTILAGRWTRDAVELERWRVGPLDRGMEPLAPRLPAAARIFDPAGCRDLFACRVSLVFGRYTAAACASRTSLVEPTPQFAALVREPTVEGLRAAGFTHVYMDAAWWRTLSSAGHTALRDGPFELLGHVEEGPDFRLLLRVCAPAEGCRLRAPGLSGPSATP